MKAIIIKRREVVDGKDLSVRYARFDGKFEEYNSREDCVADVRNTEDIPIVEQVISLDKKTGACSVQYIAPDDKDALESLTEYQKAEEAAEAAATVDDTFTVNDNPEKPESTVSRILKALGITMLVIGIGVAVGRLLGQPGRTERNT